MREQSAPDAPYELILVGGGLQNGLIALAALAAQPDRRIALIERGPALGGNHTWCVHPGDVPKAAWAWLEPLVEQRWPGYEVRFPDFQRDLQGSYAALTSERLAAHGAACFAQSPNALLRLNSDVCEVRADGVTLNDGSQLRGHLVVDARGPDPESYRGRAGYQKFLGLELEFAEPHGRTRPLLMDATVEQRDGFRFVYCLPLDAHRMLVEDTVFSARPALDLSDAPVLAYAQRFGRVSQVRRREHGVLPMPWQSEDPQSAHSPLQAGYRGGWFHPATGYSFPAALRLALHLADCDADEALDARFERLRAQHRQQARFAEHLNYLLFHGFDEGAMWHVFRRFYTLPSPLIDRFYALQMSFTDRARIMLGAPPKGFRWSAALGAAGRLA